MTCAKIRMTSAKIAAEPASITHHRVAIVPAAGPEGARVDNGPSQPASATPDPS